MDYDEEFSKAMNFLSRALIECTGFYPKHHKTVMSLWKNYMDILFSMGLDKTKKDYIKFLHYLHEFSDFIAKKYFPEEINEDWRRPIELESLINNAMFERFDNAIKEDPKFKEEIIKGLQTDPKIKDNPLTHLIEGLIAGSGVVSTEELSEITNVSHDSMLKQVEKLINKKILKPEKDFIQLDLDNFKN